MGCGEGKLVGAARCHGELDAPHADRHQGADLEELSPYGTASGVGQAGCLQSETTDALHENISHRGEPQPQLVSANGCRRGAIGEEIELALLDAVLHLAAGAIDRLIELLTVAVLLCERGDDEARIGLALRPFGLGDDTPLPIPTLAGQPEDVIDAARLAPSHQGVPRKAGIGAQHYANQRPALTDPGDNAGHFLQRTSRTVDVGRPQLRRQKLVAAEDVKRQVAVAIVIAVEETTLLVAV